MTDLHIQLSPQADAIAFSIKVAFVVGFLLVLAFVANRHKKSSKKVS